MKIEYNFGIKFVLQLKNSYLCELKNCNGHKRETHKTIQDNEGKKPIMLHHPHPGNIIKGYVLRQVLEYLQNDGMI